MENVTTLLAQIAPQRSTQYAELASALAPHELALSPLGPHIAGLEPVRLGGQDYLRVALRGAPDERLTEELGALATVSAWFAYHKEVGGEPGPWLRPVETGYLPFLPPDLVTARRYRGKTNELFTHFMCNVARHASAFAAQPWGELRLMDPLAGGGTTLLVGLMLGADVAGVEKSPQDVQSTATFLQGYAREKRIPCQVREERLRGFGRRWWLTVGRDPQRQCILAQGETVQAEELLRGVRPAHLAVADLPYGIQHRGPLVHLLGQALPVWTGLLLPGGAMALAWDATRFPRAEMLDVVGQEARLELLNEPPYDALAHRVDRVIRRRDVVVARRRE